jgi:hypothetical protein
MGPIGYPETSVRKYHSALRKIPEERRYEQCNVCGPGSLSRYGRLIMVWIVWGSNPDGAEDDQDIARNV